MGQITPNISIFIPAAGETNYDASFAAGMVNIDQHDHSGGPTKGVKISGAGIESGSITFDKLNSNVADTSTGIGTNGAAGANQLAILGLLKNIYQLVTAAGFITKDGANAFARTLVETANQIKITNSTGAGGDPVFSFQPIVTLNTQPAFLAISVDQFLKTGNGAPYLVQFTGGSSLNQGAVFDNVSTFTAPVVGGTGVYLIGVDLSLSGLDPLHTLGFVDIYINTVATFRGFNCNLGAIKNNGGGAELPYSQLCQLNAGDKVTIVVTVSNGPLTVNVDASSSFSAIKIW